MEPTTYLKSDIGHISGHNFWDRYAYDAVGNISQDCRLACTVTMQRLQVGSGTSLTDLCAICHVNPLKYTCPRCGVHTCSLPCVKRHKQWAQCSGVRDPAEYRKRSELATASSIDKDFNFITGVERSLQRADDAVTDKAIDLAPARVNRTDVVSNVEIEATARGISIIRAPKGLSRSKQNKTRWAPQFKCIMWTVEWVDPNGQRRFGHAHESKPIHEAYITTFGRKGGHLKRKRGQEGEQQDSSLASKETDDGSKKTLPTGQYSDRLRVPSSTATPNSGQADTGVEISSTAGRQDVGANQGHGLSDDGPVQENGTNPPVLDSPAAISAETYSGTSNEYHFYLHRPNTPARYKCLLPITPSQTLKSALDNATVIEFPTIYIRTEAPSELPEPFITTEEYDKRYGVDIPINISAPAGLTSSSHESLPIATTALQTNAPTANEAAAFEAAEGIIDDNDDKADKGDVNDVDNEVDDLEDGELDTTKSKVTPKDSAINLTENNNILKVVAQDLGIVDHDHRHNQDAESVTVTSTIPSNNPNPDTHTHPRISSQEII